ncbi:MAG: hypothetical protein E4H13_05630 [Calditrichales bacterium]|nr:MAG: hypothetical protein E4H13_05630 [Calditrichales bacterium]
MKTVFERIQAGEILLADGGMGSLLMQRGLKHGSCPEAINLESPEIPAEIAKLYADAGSDMVQSNTFGASPLKLAEYGLADKTEEINRAAVTIAKKAVGNSVYVYGSCGPCGQILQPFGTASPDDVFEGFKRQISAMVAAGVDLIGIETMTDLNEALLAVKAARAVSDEITVMTTMTFEDTPRGFFTIMGNTIANAAAALEEAGADLIGSNCGNGLEKMIRIAAEFKAVSKLPLIIQSNAGLPVNKAGQLHYPETPDFFGEKVSKLISAGVSVIGGCCGTTPETIRAMRTALTKLKK